MQCNDVPLRHFLWLWTLLWPKLVLNPYYEKRVLDCLETVFNCITEVKISGRTILPSRGDLNRFYIFQVKKNNHSIWYWGYIHLAKMLLEPSLSAPEDANTCTLLFHRRKDKNPWGVERIIKWGYLQRSVDPRRLKSQCVGLLIQEQSRPAIRVRQCVTHIIDSGCLISAVSYG